MNVVAPNVKSLVRGGGLFFFRAVGDSGYLDLGNLPDFGITKPTSFAEHKTSRSGVVIMDRREIAEFQHGFKVAVDEYNVENLRLLYNAAASATFSQSSATGTVVSVANPVLGRAYDLGALKVTITTVKVGIAAKTLGTDYQIEADLGMITFLPTGTILATDTVDVTFDAATVTGDQINPLTAVTSITGAGQIFLRKSDGGLWRWKHSTIQLAFSGDTTFTGGAFGKTAADALVLPDYSQSDSPYGSMVLIPGA